MSTRSGRRKEYNGGGKEYIQRRWAGVQKKQEEVQR